MVDWAAGQYERTAEDLAPVAVDVTTRARIQPGDRVLDIACGTGNAALLAAKAGAAVTGIDLASRLTDVARSTAQTEGLDVDFHVGDAQALPFGDGTFDVAVSVFGIIFAPDPKRAFSEVVRILRPGGRALITAWIPEGAIAAMSELFTRAVANASNAQPSKRFAWHEPDTVNNLAASHAADARFLEDGHVTFTADSADAYLCRYEDLHPVSQEQRPILQQAGTYEEVRAQALALLTAANESPDQFAVTSGYRVLDLTR
jgi:SAM-dependent methyltransferase